MKKYILSLAVAVCFSAMPVAVPLSQAAISVPFFNITVNEHTIGGDDTFSFHVQKIENSLSSLVEDFDIATSEGEGAYTTYSTAGSSTQFYVVVDSATVWSAPTVACTSTNPSVTFQPTVGGVIVTARPYSSITCDFTHTIQQAGASNILFIPGLQASRLYKPGSVFNSEDQLWEPNIDADIKGLYMNANGTSKNPAIYTKDIIGQTNVYSWITKQSIYKSFISTLDQMVATNAIHDWAATPYDWRYSPEYIVDHGILTNGGNISYAADLTQNQIPFIISQLTALAQSSNNGKVTIVTHSNGGFIKYFVW